MQRMVRPIELLLLVLWIVVSLGWAGGLVRPSGIVAEPLERATMSDDPPGAAPTPTGAPYPVGDLVLQGRVYKLSEPGLAPPIEGATVTALVCELPAQATTTAPNGWYSLYLHGSDLENCDSVVIDIRADGYGRVSVALPVAALRADPYRDFVLGELGGMLFLPLMTR